MTPFGVNVVRCAVCGNLGYDLRTASCMHQESDGPESPAPAFRRIGSPGTLLTNLRRLVSAGATATPRRIP